MSFTTGLNSLNTSLGYGLNASAAAAATPWTAAGLAGIMGVNTPSYYWQFAGSSPYTDTVAGSTLTIDGSGVTENTLSAFGVYGWKPNAANTKVGYKWNLSNILGNGSTVALVLLDNLSTTDADYILADYPAGYSGFRIQAQALARYQIANYYPFTSETEYSPNSSLALGASFVIGVRDENADVLQIHAPAGSSTGQTIESVWSGTQLGMHIGGFPGRDDCHQAIYCALAIWHGANAEGQDWGAGAAALAANLGL